MIDISKISSKYDVRILDESYADSILSLCKENTQFYEYCEAKPTKEQVLNDLRITPPGIQLSEKYYIGFYHEETLVAVMDLIDGYPEREMAFIGFFMMNKDIQGQGIGTAIIKETATYLKTAGKTAIRLAIDKDNPQSTHFWKKNGFVVIAEVDRNGWPILVAERLLYSDMIIRPFIASKDFNEIKNWITDEREHAMWCANLISFPMEKDNFARVMQDAAERCGDSPCVVTSDKGELIGFFCYSVNVDSNEGMFKFVMNNPQYRGKGYGKEMLRLAVKYAFENTNVQTVQLNVFPENERAKKCYESVGFTERKTDLKAFTYKDELWGRCNMIIRNH